MDFFSSLGRLDMAPKPALIRAAFLTECYRKRGSPSLHRFFIHELRGFIP